MLDRPADHRLRIFAKNLELFEVAIDDVQEEVDPHAVSIGVARFDGYPSRHVSGSGPSRRQPETAVGVDIRDGDAPELVAEFDAPREVPRNEAQ